MDKRNGFIAGLAGIGRRVGARRGRTMDKGCYPGQCARLRTWGMYQTAAGAFSMACIPMPFPAQASSSPDHGPEEIDSNADDASGVVRSLNGG